MAVRMDGRVKELIKTATLHAVPWEAATQVVHSLLGCTLTRHDSALLRAAVGECMRICLLHHKAAEALRLHALLNCSGHSMGHHNTTVRRPVGVLPSKLTAESLKGLSNDQLALIALAQQPHRSSQSTAVCELMAAEGESCCYPIDTDTSLSCPGRVWTLFPTEAFGSGLQSCILRPAPTEPTEAEEFRVRLLQNIHLLRATQRLEGRLGLYYLLSQMRHVEVDKRLSSQVEIESLVHIARALLNHPLLFATPSTETAQRQLLFEDFGRSHVDSVLSEVQRTKIAMLEASVDSVRSLCKEPLKFMHTLAASWDALFLRRAAHTLVLPDAAHNVLPHTLRRKSREGVHRMGRTRQGNEKEVDLTRWIDPNGELFGGPDMRNAMERVEFIIRRRSNHNIIVPDACFLLQNLSQLLQLARHREVVIPHSVLLEVVYTALEDQGPRRFHSRRVLLTLMRATTTCTTRRMEREGGRLLNPYSLPSRRSQSGITILGLQDEVALLECCPERFFLATALSRREQTVAETLTPSDCASVLIAKQLEKFLASTPIGSERGSALVELSEVDHLVKGLVDSINNGGTWAGDTVGSEPLSARGRPSPLFKSRSRSFWSRTPVVLATTTEKTRRAAFMVGLSLFPPVELA
ncbi:hypothetical protein ERJ75_000770400 [Trypanosoma vivax]|uniref:PIN domain-containing protein n=1 Tax=Trypanosoma vivax (strain Y486) TaxID=1055687 RepID=G0U3N0_TRYVY|nr:hypothetical protein TRVL_06128 [Trypanosoma vivax]KAH8613656.1 hypothetical protein ERJ75_000770400 [Trypanosoma vivax]CCC50887.1 conserved hypothetical protein [Trypanosoma vivax Y486]